ncbi:MAG: TIGR03960 family B12-binding radical SAM protein [Thermoguttaceae bacterium]|nr:TIGR03960 family B12-binding radical SAM protein [Thermoguttaceae bacterium]
MAQPYFFDPDLRRSVESLLLPDIRLPGQYIGGEVGQIVKPADSVKARLCFCFPDVYSIGMSNVALAVLYDVVNRRADLACERAFCPGTDFEQALRDNRLPLYSLESFTPLNAFDVLGFTLQYELCYTSVLTMLDLARIPIRREERGAELPLIIAGGPASCNPEPMADFIDVFLIGDGEESLQQTLEIWAQLKEQYGVERALASRNGNLNINVPDPEKSKALRAEMILELVKRVPSAYAPQFYSVEYDANGRALRPRPIRDDVQEYVHSAIVRDLNAFPPPKQPLIPLIESVQDRISVEIMRGCPQKCRFCQSTQLKRPIRTRSVDLIIDTIREASANTGVDEATLLSLSSSEYPKFEDALAKISAALSPCGVSLAVPSLRVNHQLSSVVQELTTERSSSLTVAPEAARDEMRRRIAKRVTNDDLFAGCRAAFEHGFARIKMYFMCGFPNETEEDLVGIVALANDICRLGKEVRGKWAQVVANVSNFVPKPHTPLQWEAMRTREYFTEAHRILRTTKRERSVEVKYHALNVSLLEGLLARGDRRVGRVIETAWRLGARLDPWHEHFRPELWEEAIAQNALNVELIAHTPYSLDAELPWDHVVLYNSKELLKKEHALSEQMKFTELG